MIEHQSISNQMLKRQIKNFQIGYGGNKKLKIYGTLHCSSGKRMKRENRVFFRSISEAIRHDFRPCGHCMREAYKTWKDGVV